MNLPNFLELLQNGATVTDLVDSILEAERELEAINQQATDATHITTLLNAYVRKYYPEIKETIWTPDSIDTTIEIFQDVSKFADSFIEKGDSFNADTIIKDFLNKII